MRFLGYLVAGWLTGWLIVQALATPPRVQASVWLNRQGEGRIGDKFYRLTDAKGGKVTLPEGWALTILDTRP